MRKFIIGHTHETVPPAKAYAQYATVVTGGEAAGSGNTPVGSPGKNLVTHSANAVDGADTGARYSFLAYTILSAAGIVAIVMNMWYISMVKIDENYLRRRNKKNFAAGGD